MNSSHTTLSEAGAAGPQPGKSHHLRWKVTFWMFGGMFLAGAVLSTVLLIIVRLFGLENDQWQRPDSHITVYSAVLQLNVGVLLVMAARSSGKRRFLWAALAIITWVGLGTRNLGIVAW